MARGGAKEQELAWQGDNEPGLPRPLFDHPDLGLKPVPWTTETDRRSQEPIFSVAHAERLRECWEMSLCALCGEVLDQQVTAIFYLDAPPDGIGNPGRIIDGPLHGRCARMTAAHCPPLTAGVRDGRYRIGTISVEIWELLRNEETEGITVETVDGGYAPLRPELISFDGAAAAASV